MSVPIAVRALKFTVEARISLRAKRRFSRCACKPSWKLIYKYLVTIPLAKATKTQNESREHSITYQVANLHQLSHVLYCRGTTPGRRESNVFNWKCSVLERLHLNTFATKDRCVLGMGSLIQRASNFLYEKKYPFLVVLARKRKWAFLLRY